MSFLSSISPTSLCLFRMRRDVMIIKCKTSLLLRHVCTLRPRINCMLSGSHQIHRHRYTYTTRLEKDLHLHIKRTRRLSCNQHILMVEWSTPSTDLLSGWDTLWDGCVWDGGMRNPDLEACVTTWRQRDSWNPMFFFTEFFRDQAGSLLSDEEGRRVRVRAQVVRADTQVNTLQVLSAYSAGCHLVWQFLNEKGLPKTLRRPSTTPPSSLGFIAVAMDQYFAWSPFI